MDFRYSYARPLIGRRRGQLEAHKRELEVFHKPVDAAPKKSNCSVSASFLFLNPHDRLEEAVFLGGGCGVSNEERLQHQGVSFHSGGNYQRYDRQAGLLCHHAYRYGRYVNTPAADTCRRRQELVLPASRNARLRHHPCIVLFFRKVLNLIGDFSPDLAHARSSHGSPRNWHSL